MSDTTQLDIVRIPDGRPRGLDLLVGALCAVIAMLAAAMCVLRPEQLAAWILTMLFLPLVLTAVRVVPGLDDGTANTHRVLMLTVLVSGVLVAIPLLLRVAETLGWLEYVAVRRGIGVLLGGAVLLAGSYFPSRWMSQARQRFGTAAAGQALRFARWGVMFGGVAYATLWALAPLDVANLWASTALAATVTLVALRGLLVLRAGSANKPD